MIILDNRGTLLTFRAWSGGKYTQEIIFKHCKTDDFDRLIEELHPKGITPTELNDLLWFEDEWIFEQLGIDNE